jgi:hypothetical protein
LDVPLSSAEKILEPSAVEPVVADLIPKGKIVKKVELVMERRVAARRSSDAAAQAKAKYHREYMQKRRAKQKGKK